MTDLPKLANLAKWTDALWIVVLAVYIIAGASLIPFHGDESTQIFMGRDYYYLFVEGDFAKVFYDRNLSTRQDEQELRIINGTISKTVHGWLAANMGLRPDQLNGHWDWSLDYATNRDSKRIPDLQLLQRARFASAVQLSMAALVLFFFVRMTIGRPAAYLASAVFTLHPAILFNGRRAMMEGSLLLGMVLVLLAAAWLIRERKWRCFVLLGCASGAAIAAKHTNAFVVAVVFLACASVILVEAAQSPAGALRSHIRALAKLLLSGILALAVFYLMNPAWWQAPIEVAGEILALRVDLLEEQTDKYGGYAAFDERVQGFARFVFGTEKQYFEVSEWANIEEIGAQIDAYEASGLAGIDTGSGDRMGIVTLGLAILGTLLIVRDPNIDWRQRWLLLIWGAGIMLITFVFTPLPWQRYYLPALPFVIMMAAFAAARAMEMLLKLVKTRLDGFSLLD